MIFAIFSLGLCNAFFIPNRLRNGPAVDIMVCAAKGQRKQKGEHCIE